MKQFNAALQQGHRCARAALLHKLPSPLALGDCDQFHKAFTLPPMFRPSASDRSRRWVWLALCVFTLSAWMPTLSAWVASSRSQANWLEVCSANTGALLVAAADQVGADPAGTGHQPNGSGHCPFCLIQDHAPPLPAKPDAPALAIPASAAMIPPLLLHAPRPLHAWSPLAARAPPLAA
jgi:Protein of unknown function (DUF2946)